MRKPGRVAVVVVAVLIAGVVVALGLSLLPSRGGGEPEAVPHTPTEVVEAWHRAVIAGDAARAQSLSCGDVSTYVRGLLSDAHDNAELRDHLTRRHVTAASVEAEEASVTVVYDLWRDGPDLHHDVRFTMHLANRNGWKFCGYR